MSHKVKLEGELLEKAEQCAEASGYASVDEFVLHTIEKEIKRLMPPEQGGNAAVHMSPSIAYVRNTSTATCMTPGMALTPPELVDAHLN